MARQRAAEGRRKPVRRTAPFRLLVASALVLLLGLGLASLVAAGPNDPIVVLRPANTKTEATAGVQTVPADKVTGTTKTASVPVSAAAPATTASATVDKKETDTKTQTVAATTKTGTKETGSASESATRTGSASTAATATGSSASAASGSSTRTGSSTASTQSGSSQSSRSTTSQTVAVPPGGMPGIQVTVTSAPKTLVIYMTSSTTMSTASATVMTTQLPDGSIITISGNGGSTSSDNSVGGVPVKNLIIAGCVVGGAILVSLIGVYGYKFLRGGQRDSLEERKRGKTLWSSKKAATQLEEGDSPDNGQWDRDFAWNSPLPPSGQPSLNKKASQESLRGRGPASATVPMPGWQQGAGTQMSSAEDLMASLTQSIHGSAASTPQGQPQMSQVNGRPLTMGTAPSSEALAAAGFSAPAKPPKPIPNPIITGRTMVRSTTAPQLGPSGAAAAAAAVLAGQRDDQVRGTPQSFSGAASMGSVPALGSLAGTTTINAAKAMASFPTGRGRSVSSNPGLRVEIPYRESQSNPDTLLQRYATNYQQPAAKQKPVKAMPGRSATFQASQASQHASPTQVAQAQLRYPQKEGTWPMRPDVRASVYSDNAIAHFGGVPVPGAPPARMKPLPMPLSGVPEQPPKRTASSNKLKEGVPWEAVVDVVDEYGRPTPASTNAREGSSM